MRTATTQDRQWGAGVCWAYLVAGGDAATLATPPVLPPRTALQVRYGAERVFSSEATNITDEDVDALIAKGEAATKELNDKLQNFSNDAMRFTMDGGINGGCLAWTCGVCACVRERRSVWVGRRRAAGVIRPVFVRWCALLLSIFPILPACLPAPHPPCLQPMSLRRRRLGRRGMLTWPRWSSSRRSWVSSGQCPTGHDCRRA
jgi:hypothetical protein